MLRSDLHIRLSGTFAIALLLSSFTLKGTDEGTRESSVTVTCTEHTGLVEVNIESHRKIGAVRLEFRDASGRTVYLEEGKAMTDELVRKLDKGLFPKGEAVLTVSARDFSITQRFVVP